MTIAILCNDDGSYMNADQIVADLGKRITDEATLDAIKNDFASPSDADEITAICLHFERFRLGMWIRNFYGMWRTDNPYTHPMTDDPDDPLHPDNLSANILYRFARHLREEPDMAPPAELPAEEIIAESIADDIVENVSSGMWKMALIPLALLIVVLLIIVLPLCLALSK